jgi:hypothetical protein
VPLRASRLESTVFLLSAAILAFEILLLRLFAIEHLHHFANMAIGMAMLGFGASGTALVLARQRVRGRERVWFEGAATLFTASLVVVIPLAHIVDFDPTQILWDIRQWRALALVYATLAVPFALGAAALALALMAARERVGRVYAANLMGSAVGSLLAVALLALFRPERAVAATSIPAAMGAALALLVRVDAVRIASQRRRKWMAVVLIVVAVAATVRPPWTPRISAFKGQPQVAAFADATSAGERWGPVGWSAAIRAPAFRHAPGLSLAFTGELPPQIALFVDGATVGAATDWRGDTTAVAFLRWLPSAAAYVGSPPRAALVLGSGDGLEVLAALSHGAREVTAVELNEPLAALANAVLPPASRAYSDPRVRLVTGDIRAFVARSRETFDLIIVPIGGGLSGTTAALHGVGEDYLNTVEAYATYLARLAPRGTLALTRWADTPPRDNVKVLLTAAAALRRHGITRVGESVVVLRSWASMTLLVRPAGFSESDLAGLTTFARDRLFDIDWPEGLLPAVHDALPGAPEAGPPATAGILPGDVPGADSPGASVLSRAVHAAAVGEREAKAFAHAYAFDISPATDDRPYFGRFLRLSSVGALLGSPRGAWLPFVEWGYLALLVTLLQSAAIAALLTLLPVLLLTRASRRGSHATLAPDDDRLPLAKLMRVGVYFGAIGGAYLFIEIAMIQKLTLLLGHPVYAAAAVLALFLALSGVGSLWSDRVQPSAAAGAAVGVALVALVVALALDASARIQPLAFPGRLAASLLLLAPLAFCMGMPFPLGLRGHARGHAALAWAWAVNGFASVIAASLAALVAMEIGTRALLLCGAALYLLAAAFGRGRRSPRDPAAEALPSDVAAHTPA